MPTMYYDCNLWFVLILDQAHPTFNILGLPDISLRSPVCYDCSYASSVEECHSITLCNPDEVIIWFFFQ